MEQFDIRRAIRAVLVLGWLLARAAGGWLLRLLSIPLRVFRGVGPNVFASLIGVFVGSAITFAWDILKTSRDQQAELLRAARSVDQETQNNLAVISNDLFTLTSDDVEADKRAEVVTPPVMPLLTAAGETAYLHGSFEVYSPELAIGIGNVYTIHYIINKRIEGRDFVTAHPPRRLSPSNHHLR